MSKMSDPKASGKRSLSSATLNMRFMQRKTMRESTDTSGHNRDVQLDSKSSKEPINQSLSSRTMFSNSVLLASQVDMYGDVIGRRSFNMFNRAVEDTYKKELDAKLRQQQGEKSSREAISDDELLRRYELYVKGKINAIR